MTCGYRIWIRGEYDISVLSPEIMALLVEKVKKAASKDLIIPVEEIIPRGYAEYLVRVLEVNMTTEAPCDMRAVYGMTARQIGALKVEEHKCFDRACLRTQACGTQFDLSASAAFYMLAKQSAPNFTYICKDSEGKEISWKNAPVCCIIERKKRRLKMEYQRATGSFMQKK